MIPRALEAEILRLHHAEKWPVGTIATQLGLHHSTVRRVLAQAGRAGGAASVRAVDGRPVRAVHRRDAREVPALRASRLYAMVRERGYPGAPDHFRAIVARFRPRPAAEAYLRLRTLPGEQAQVDWAHFGKLTHRPRRARAVGLRDGAVVLAAIFPALLSGRAMPSFLRGHVEAFADFKAVSRACCSTTISRAPCSSARATRSAFIPRCSSWRPTTASSRGRWRWRAATRRGASSAPSATSATASSPRARFRDLDDLNAQARAWAPARRRSPVPGGSQRAPSRELFAEERRSCSPCPRNPFPAEERVDGERGQDPLRALRPQRLLGPAHPRPAHARGARQPRHGARPRRPPSCSPPIRAAWTAARRSRTRRTSRRWSHDKRAARDHRALDRLQHAAPAPRPLFLRAAERGAHLGRAHPRAAGSCSTATAPPRSKRPSPRPSPKTRAHLGAVRHLIDAHAHARGQRPPIAVALPADPRLTAHACARSRSRLRPTVHGATDADDDDHDDQPEPQP